MVVKDILQVLYAPHKIFKKIIENPGYLGIFVLILIFVIARVSFSYVTSSRLYIEKTMPIGTEGDIWTENVALWQANPGVVVTANNVDFINGSQAILGFPDYYGNNSIKFTISDSHALEMSLNDLGGQVNCGADGFNELFYRIKIVTPETNPQNVTLILYSLNGSFFYYDLTVNFVDSLADVWSNMSIPLGSANWLSNGSPKWENITGLKMEFDWFDSADIDLSVDGLFFRNNFANQVELAGGILQLIGYATFNAFAPFLSYWLALSVLIYIIIKGFKGNVIWRPLMVAVGYALITIVIQSAIVAAIYTTMPDLYYPLELLAYVPGEFEGAQEVIINQLANISMIEYILQFATWIWIVGLGTFIVRAITGSKKIAEEIDLGKAALEGTASGETAEFSWMKCLLVSGLSMFITIFILGFLGIT